MDIFREAWCTTLFVLLIIALHTSCGFLGWDKLTLTLQQAVQGLAEIGREVSLYYDLFALGGGCVIRVSLFKGVHDYGIDWDGPITMDGRGQDSCSS